MAEPQVEPSPGQLALVASPSADTTTIDIATADGDILLVLGETRLRVSSVILSSASPVFKAMLGPNFLEGQGERSAQSPKEISLPDDDISAMTQLCRILHHQYRTEDNVLTSHCVEGLFALTVVSDKYGCTDSIEAVAKHLLSELGTTSVSPLISPTTLLVLSAVAYKIKDCRHFALFTRRLVLGITLPYSGLAGEDSLESLPNLFLCKCLVSVGVNLPLTSDSAT